MGSVERAAAKAKVLYAPMLPFGLSPHHMGEAGWGTGSISLPAEIYRDVLYAIGRSLIFARFNKLVYVSHHGTNMAPREKCCGRSGLRRVVSVPTTRPRRKGTAPLWQT